MKSEPTYEELALVLSHCVYDYLYQPEPWNAPDGTLTGKMTVDNGMTTALQIVTGVLNRIKILAPLDNLGRRNDFTCKPAEFDGVISENKNNGCSYDMMVFALVNWLEYWLNLDAKDWVPESNIIDCLVRLNLCEQPAPADIQEKIVIWTEKVKKYDKLYQHWPERLAEKDH